MACPRISVVLVALLGAPLVALGLPPDTPHRPLGAIRVESAPEPGMTIVLNGSPTGLVTPATLANLPPGEHSVRLVSPWYRVQEQQVTLAHGQQVVITFRMAPAFALITITTNPDGVIHVDGQPMGTSLWKGRLREGERHLRVEKPLHVPREFELVVTPGRDLQIDLMMERLRCPLEVVTHPPGATIEVDGRLYGLTPMVIDNLPPGTYQITLTKSGHTTAVRSVSLSCAQPTTLTVHLASGREVTILSQPQGATLTLNDTVRGQTPVTLWLPFGSHHVRLEIGGMVAVETIPVAHAGPQSFTFSLRDTHDPFQGQMVRVVGGTFRMGDATGEGKPEDRPPHEVTLTSFYISRFEVTQAQWRQVMGTDPSHHKSCERCPVERVSWQDVQEFLAKLNLLTGKGYRLPTEAEWEYAARGGHRSQGLRFAGSNNINDVAWYSVNSGGRTQPVGGLAPNELGLHDMSGNVWEWCSDWFAPYTIGPKSNPKGPETGDLRMVRGGSWFGYVGGSRVSSRASDLPLNRRSYIGFRIALPAEAE